MLCDGPNKSLFISLARDFLIECDNAKSYQQLMNDGNVENGNKLRTYRQYSLFSVLVEGHLVEWLLLAKCVTLLKYCVNKNKNKKK